jgi:hypothetical protein
MATSPIRIPITADAQYSAALSTAEARVRAFGATSGLAGESIKRSFHEARGSVDILSETIGVRLGRELKGVLATGELLGPILSASFPLIAAFGFYEILSKIGEKLANWYYDAEGLKQFGEDIKATTEFLVKLGDEVDHLNKQAAEAGVSAQQKWATALDEATKKLDKQNETTRRLKDTIYALEQGRLQNAFGTSDSILGNTAADIPHLKDLYAEATALAAKYYSEQQAAQAELSVAQRAGMEAYNKLLEDAAKKAADSLKKLDDFLFRIRQERTKAAPSISSFSDNQLSTGLIAIQEPNQAIADKYLATFRAMRQLFIDTMPPAERLRFEIDKLNQLFGDNRGETYQRALAQIKQKYDQAGQAAREFGRAAGEALQQGILMGRSWKDVLESLVVTVTELIIRMTLLKKLEESYGEGGSSGGWGGFLTAIVGGLAGKAGGGQVYADGAYMVGEHGPEPFFPNTNGTILPAGSLGGTHITYQIDARGSAPGVERDILRALKQTEDRAVARAVGIVRENSLRGRG